MKSIKLMSIAFAGATLLSGCVSSTQPSGEVEQAPPKTTADAAKANQAASTPAQPAATIANADGKSRLVIYRTNYAGLAVQPKVFVDGHEVTSCTPGKATTVEVTPGTHQVTSQVLAEKAVRVSVPKGHTAYVKCSITVGLVVGGVRLVTVPASEAAPRVAKLQGKS